MDIGVTSNNVRHTTHTAHVRHRNITRKENVSQLAKADGSFRYVVFCWTMLMLIYSFEIVGHLSVLGIGNRNGIGGALVPHPVAWHKSQLA